MNPDPTRAGRAELAALPDEALVSAYEALRDERVDGRYPHLARLAGTPFEREKDRREVAARLAASEPEMQAWYRDAAARPCRWWLEHQRVARHALRSCMSCGVCASACPAAEVNEGYNPRQIVAAAVSGDEAELEALLSSDTLWLCGQCGSCRPRCPRDNDVMSLIGALRQLAELKGWHARSVRGRQQVFARHLWGGNFWNRACSLYFRNVTPEGHPDFGQRFATWQREVEGQMVRLGAEPDRDGTWCGRKVHPDTLAELRACVQAGGTLVLWQAIDDAAAEDAGRLGLDLDAYHDLAGSEG